MFCVLPVCGFVGERWREWLVVYHSDNVTSLRRLQEDSKRLEAECERVREERLTLEAQEQEVKKEQLAVKHELEKHAGVISDNEKRLKYWRKELDKLALSSVEGETPPALPEYSAEHLTDVCKEDVQYEMTLLEEKLAQMKPNMAAIAEYKKKVSAGIKRRQLLL